MKNLNKIFAIIKIIIGILTLSLAIAYTVTLTFTKLDSYITKNILDSIPSNTNPGILLILLATFYSFVSIYYFKSAIREYKKEQPIYLFIRIIINIFPAILFTISIFPMIEGLRDKAIHWSLHNNLFVAITPILIFIFWREMFLGKIYKKK